MPADSEIIQNCEPVYTEHEGWSENTVGIQELDRMPDNARRYIDSLTELLETPFMMISTGPDREQTIRLEPLFKS